jgi:hypothetical protein
MRERANQSKAISAYPAPVVLFGIDGRGKPKAARFGKQHAGLAVKAATQLQLQILVANDRKIADLASRLPVGRVHATGRTFVPFVRRDLYDHLVLAAGNGATHADPPSHGSSGASGSAPNGSAPHLPKNWQGIGVDDLVVAYQGQEDGWYEAIVAQVDGDMLTLRWRDYPRERRFTRHRNRVGLLYPNGEQTLRPAGQAKSIRNTRAKLQPTSLPTTGNRSTSAISCSPKTMGHGGRGGKLSPSKGMATCSSCVGRTFLTRC